MKGAPKQALKAALDEALEADRTRTFVVDISPLGLVEMTRQRVRPSLKRSVYADCPCCNGRGVVKTAVAGSASRGPILVLWAGQTDSLSRVTCTTIAVDTLGQKPVNGLRAITCEDIRLGSDFAAVASVNPAGTTELGKDFG